jgi:predicted 3-demethylubiquinone-9 3-methyltransferase (glyoxalase superfamily)
MKRNAMPTLQEIAPCLWFDDQAEEAARFYLSIFTDSKIESIARYTKAGFEIHGRPDGSVMTVDFHLAGQNFTALNGGPLFKFTPAISFFVVCESEAEVDALWKALAHRGEVLMDLAKYDWSEKYGWLNDRYGLSWQIALGKFADAGQKITPSLMFVGAQNGRAEEALKYYASIFEGSGIDGILRYGPGEAVPPGRAKVHGDGQRARSPVYVRSHFLPGALRNTGRGGLLLVEAFSRRRSGGAAVRLAQGQIRRLLAGRSHRSYRNAPRLECTQGGARDESIPPNEEI